MFDIIIGNPPYIYYKNENKGGKEVYIKFTSDSINIARRVLFIMPDSFLKMARNKNDSRKLIDYINRIKSMRKSVYPNVMTSIVEFDRSCVGSKNIEVNSLQLSKDAIISAGYVNDVDISRLLMSNVYCTCCRRVHSFYKIAYCGASQKTRALGSNPFGFKTNHQSRYENLDIKQGKDNVLVMYAIDKYYSAPLEHVIRNKNIVNKYKVLCKYTISENSNKIDYHIISPSVVCTESFLVVDYADSIDEAKEIKSYLENDLIQRLVLSTMVNRHLTRNNFTYVPLYRYRSILDSLI